MAKVTAWGRRIAALMLVLAAASCSRQAEPLKSEYTLHVAAGPTTFWGMGAAAFAQIVKEKTGGQIVVQLAFGGDCVGPSGTSWASRVSSGEFDCAVDSTLDAAAVVPQMNVFALPFFVGSYDNIDALEAGRTGQLLTKAMESRGLVVLAWGENGFRYLTNGKRPVLTPADIKGLRIRVEDNPVLVDIFRALGAVPVTMPWGQAVPALQARTVDGQENPMEILLSEQVDRYQRYMTCWNYAADPLIFYWNARQFRSFPADVQKAIHAAAEEAARFQKYYARVGLDDGTAMVNLMNEFEELAPIGDPLTYLRSKGMTVVEPTEPQLRAFEAVLLPVRDRWVKQIGRKIYRAALADMGVTPGRR
jgi:TRAP-type transport system periplasmic protein